MLQAGHEERGGHRIPPIQLALVLNSSTGEFFFKKAQFPIFGRLTLTIVIHCLLTPWSLDPECHAPGWT